MDLALASGYFDRTAFHDAYTGAFAFLGQIGLYDEGKRDSESTLRRVISTSATALVPARRAVRAGTKVYLIGESHPDEFCGSTVRVGYVSQAAEHLVDVKTLAEACLGASGTPCYGARTWVKDRAFSEQDSHLTPSFHVHLADTEVVREYDVLVIGSAYYIVRSVVHAISGMVTCLADEMPGAPRELATITSGDYSAATESWSGANVQAYVLRLRWQSVYQYIGDQRDNFEAGDIQIAVPLASATVKVGSQVSMSDGDWWVRGVFDLGNVRLCRVSRRA